MSTHSCGLNEAWKQKIFYRPCRPSLAVRTRDAESSGPVSTAHNISINVTMWQVADWPTSLQCSHDNKAGSLQWQKASCTPDLRTARHSVAQTNHLGTNYFLARRQSEPMFRQHHQQQCVSVSRTKLLWLSLRSVTGTKEKMSWWRAALTHGRGRRGTY